jgi:hypothetical protein
VDIRKIKRSFLQEEMQRDARSEDGKDLWERQMRFPKPPQQSCACSPDIDDADWQCCDLCRYEAYCDDERDRQRDNEFDRDYYIELMDEHDNRL